MTLTAPASRFSPAERFATGLRNGEGIAFDAAGRIFATQHGRDQLRENWSALYTAEQGANEPAEELVQLERGADFGWPYCYFDLSQQKLVLAPEYGGDGGKAIGPCAGKRAPVAAFPAHWAPNDLAIYDGQQFPAPYRGGAFIAFHGSWNRAPSPQGGYNVVFQPLADGKATGNYVVFADGFAGASKEPGRAAHRPSGLAVGPDGALYVSDDQRGRIWRIVFRGDTAVGVEPLRPRRRARQLPPLATPPRRGRPRACIPMPAPRSPEACRRLPGRPRNKWNSAANFPRPGWRHVRRMPRRRRQGHAAGAGPDRREMAVGRRQHPVDRRDHHQGRAEAEGVSQRHAADGRSPARPDAGSGARRLCLVSQPPERRVRPAFRRPSRARAPRRTDRRLSPAAFRYRSPQG